MNLAKLFRERILDPVRRAQGSPASIARGVALGTWIGLTPTVGMQMFIVTLLAIPLRANIPVAVALVWISNPFTVPPLYYAFHWLGSELLGSDPGAMEQMAGHFAEPASRLVGLGRDYLWPMAVGSVVIATVCAIPAYVLTHRIVTRRRAGKAAQAGSVQGETHP